MSTIIQLTHPITTHAGPVASLTLRDIVARDLVKMRTNPITFFADGHYEVNYALVMAYLVELSGVDDLTLGDLPGKDFAKCQRAITEMLVDMGNGEA